jgi:peptidoglycan/LPS O-acetylase OafA/YrhL
MYVSHRKKKADIYQQGLRGIAGVLVVFHHLRCGFAPDYNLPPSPGAHIPIFQLPYLRLLITGGNFCVAIFFILSGFVCSIKSLRRGRAEDKDGARNVASDSIVRRAVRLIVPPTIATFVSWVCSQTGAYTLAYDYGSWWLARVQGPIPGFIPPLASLCRNWVIHFHISLRIGYYLDGQC